MNLTQASYADFLSSYNWETYWTQTFRRLRHDGCNAALAWFSKMSEITEATRAFVAVEFHRLGGVHLHALFARDTTPFPFYYDLDAAAKKYMDKAFGFSHYSANFNSNEAVLMYCSKYITKGNDYYFLGDTIAWKSGKKCIDNT